MNQVPDKKIRYTYVCSYEPDWSTGIVVSHGLDIKPIQ